LSECEDYTALAAAAGTDPQTLKRLNPALLRWCTPPDVDSVAVRLPLGTQAGGFWGRYAQIPPEKKVNYIRHVVRSGETLSSIASRYGVPLRMIADHPQNRIRNMHRLSIGQVLVIPGLASRPGARTAEMAAAVEAEESPAALDGGGVHRVRRGETLGGISARYGIGLDQLRELNGLSRSSLIYPGQVLRLSGGDQAAPATTRRMESSVDHLVAYGDTLWSIARRYGVTVEALRRANGLTNRNLIKPGQILKVPANN